MISGKLQWPSPWAPELHIYLFSVISTGVSHRNIMFCVYKRNLSIFLFKAVPCPMLIILEVGATIYQVVPLTLLPPSKWFWDFGSNSFSWCLYATPTYPVPGHPSVNPIHWHLTIHILPSPHGVLKKLHNWPRALRLTLSNLAPMRP